MLTPESFPKTVKVGGFTVKINFVHEHHARSEGRFGAWHPMTQEIEIDQTLLPEKILDTFLHELMHAVYWVYNIQDEDCEERMCNILSSALHQIIRDNPALWSMIGKLKWPIIE